MAESPLDVNEKIIQCKPDFGPGISLGFRMLLQRIFVVDPNMRPTLDQLKLENVFAVSSRPNELLTICQGVDWVKAEAR